MTILDITFKQHLLANGEAACAKNGDYDLPFPDEKLTAHQKNLQIYYAKQLCRSCPLMGPCLKFALDNNEEYGVWGGMSEKERQRLKAAKAVLSRRR